jgi:hypothetical protein
MEVGEPVRDPEKREPARDLRLHRVRILDEALVADAEEAGVLDEPRGSALASCPGSEVAQLRAVAASVAARDHGARVAHDVEHEELCVAQEDPFQAEDVERLLAHEEVGIARGIAEKRELARAAARMGKASAHHLEEQRGAAPLAADDVETSAAARAPAMTGAVLSISCARL